MNNNTVNLIKLIQENPGIPVIPLISERFVDYCNLYSDYTAAELGTSFLSKYCYYDFEGTIEFIIFEEKTIIEDYLTRNHVKDIKSVMSQIDWKPAIFVHWE